MALYDTIGRTYAITRRPDPRLAAHIHMALGDARTVVNVGAGSGSYEPADAHVVAVEPSRVMIAQRAPGAAPAIQAVAGALPFATGSFDAAMAVLSDHHWADRAAGLREMQRVARRVVVFQWDPAAPTDFWLTRDYLPGFQRLVQPGMAGHGAGEILSIADVATLLGDAEVRPVPIPWDCADGFYGAFWRRPEMYLDQAVRDGISVFARLDPAEVDSAVQQLAADLASGRWQARNADLLALDELDLGYRLVVATAPSEV